MNYLEFGDLDHIYRGVGEFSPKIYLEPVDGFHIT